MLGVLTRSRRQRQAALAVQADGALVGQVRDIQRQLQNVSDRELKDRADDLRGEFELSQRCSK